MDSEYWVNRLTKDSEKIVYSKKSDLLKYLLVNTVPLDEKESEYFLFGEKKTLDDILTYATIERKVAIAYGKASKPTRNENFLKKFKELLGDYYTKDEVDDLSALLVTDFDIDFAIHLLAGDHPSFRRIRNAYLPEISEVIKIDKNGACDLTKDLFNGPEDASDQIDKITGYKK